MLPKAKMVRAAIEKMYEDTCTVTCMEEYQKENGATGFKSVVKYQDAPCKLSYSSDSATVQGEEAATAGQTIKLFIAPEVVIPAGSTISVTHEGVTEDYKKSGIRAVYSTHQEIVLEREENA